MTILLINKLKNYNNDNLTQKKYYVKQIIMTILLKNKK